MCVCVCVCVVVVVCEFCVRERSKDELLPLTPVIKLLVGQWISGAIIIYLKTQCTAKTPAPAGRVPVEEL